MPRMRLLLWCLLLVVAWPLALALLVLYPVLWLVSLPLRLLGATVEGLFELVLGLVLLPVRIAARVLCAV